MKLISTTIAAVLLIGAASLASANMIVNGDFEDDVGLTGTNWNVNASINGWTTLTGAGIEVQRNTIVAAQSGNQYVELDSHNNSAMYQEITGLTVGQSYMLSFWYHARTNNGDNDNGINVLWGESTPGALQLAIADETLISTNNAWIEKTLSLFASQTTMFLTFSAVGLDNSLGGFVDNVSLNMASVPESSGLILFGIGLLGLVLSRRRVQ